MGSDGGIAMDRLGSSATSPSFDSEEFGGIEETEGGQHVYIPLDPSTRFSWRKLWAFMGPGFLISIAYIDPGNLETDIVAGSQFRYSLLWVLASATALGLLLQTLAARLGLVTQKDLAQLCRQSYSPRVSFCLWIVTELTIIASDVPEVIGTAIAFKLLFGTPLWIGVLITCLSVFVFLAISVFGVRKLELLIGGLLSVVFFCFIIEFFLSDVSALGLVQGFVPSLNRDSLYAATSLIGAVVMPHNLFLHSSLVQSRHVGRSHQELQEACCYNLYESAIALSISLCINIAVLSIAAAEFFPNSSVGLQAAPELLDSVLGSGHSAASVLFSIALLASGQSSTMTGTYAGQFVMEGFLDLKMDKWKRAVLTRSVAIIPSLAVVLVAGDQGSDGLIVFSQSVLSVLLPFALIPLVKFTNNAELMHGFHNTFWTKVGAICLGTLVSIANIGLVFSTLSDAIADYATAVRALTWICTAALSIGYIVSLLYLITKPLQVT